VIVHPGIIALFIGAILVLLLTAVASVLGLVILRRWDRGDSGEYQLQLERRTYLVSSLLGYGFAFEVASLFLFIYTLDELNGRFAGAMCATGVLNANPVGWPLLLMKVVSFFLCGCWLAVNGYDQRSDNMPLVRYKYGALFLLLPYFMLETWLLFRYFGGLTPSIITSCCGTLFSSSEKTLAGGLSALPMRPAMIGFYAASLAYAVLLLFFRRKGGRMLAGLTAAGAFGYLAVALAAVISFISVYFYEMPTHHCPFDILQGEYHYVGYPLYAGLLGSVFCGMMAALADRLTGMTAFAQPLAGERRKWTGRALVWLAVFLLVSGYPLVTGSFSMRSYL